MPPTVEPQAIPVDQQECYDAILLYTDALDRIAVEVRAAAASGDQGRVDALLTRARRLEAVRDRFGVALARAASPR